MLPQRSEVHLRTRSLVGLTACLFIAACGDNDNVEGEATESTESALAASEGSEGTAVPTSALAAPEEPIGPPKRIFAKRFVANIRSEARHDADKLGYMRGGSVVSAKAGAAVVRDPGCPRGWYELSTGGFVCSGRDVIAFEGETLPQARGLQPDFDAPLPYEYGRVRSKAPLYRRPPTDEEAAQYEGYVIPGSVPTPVAVAGQADAATPGAAPAAGEAAPTAAPAGAAVPTTAGAPAPTSAAALASAVVGAIPEEPPPPVTLGTLAGEQGSPIIRYLVPGFILSLDRVFSAGSRRYYRTQNNGFVPRGKIGPRTGSDFVGVPLEEGGPSLPIAYVVSRGVRGFERNDAGKLRPSRAASLAYHDRIIVESEELEGEKNYLRTAEGHLYSANDLVVIRAIPRPESVPAGATWIDVNLTDQTIVAYEDERPVYATLTSTGRIRRAGVPDLDHRTLTGTFQIRAKHVTTTMDGDSAVDGPYSIEDVPYVMYYDGAYAIHSAFWHDRFGHTRSHGCVNLAPLDARWFFRWAGPHLGEGWHGAFPSGDNQGTYVVIRGETPRG